MGIFDSLQKLTKATVRTALLPLDIVKDVATLGGAITDEESSTGQALEEIGDLLGEAYDEIDE